jgi:hypothetical protein
LWHVFAELRTFFKKVNYASRQTSLGTMNHLVVAYGDKITSSKFEVIITELPSLIRVMECGSQFTQKAFSCIFGGYTYVVNNDP